MNATSNSPILIEKEAVRKLTFPNAEVLSSTEDRRRRDIELNRALVLGNMDRSKVRIIFSDDEGKKMIETTIWAVTPERIILKSGMMIPVNRIHEIVT
jgi:hypothetical protein